MFKFLGRLFGTDAAMESAIDGVKSGLDKLIYTDEEKAEDIAKDRSEARKMVIGWMAATQGQNLARRLIALTVTGIWAVQYVASMLIDVAVIWVRDPEMVHNLNQSSNAINESAQQMNGAVMLVLAFYFAAPHMGSVVGVALQRFGKQKE